MVLAISSVFEGVQSEVGSLCVRSEVGSWRPVCVASEQAPVTYTDCSKAVASDCRALNVAVQREVGRLCVQVPIDHRPMISVPQWFLLSKMCKLKLEAYVFEVKLEVGSLCAWRLSRGR